MRTVLVGFLALALVGSGSALAQEMAGEAAAGEEHFAGKCGSCHRIENEAGEVLAGSGRINLYGVAGRVPGSLPDVSYSDLMIAYSETGTVWEEANFVHYVPDPTAFLREVTGESGSSRMPSGVVRDEQEAHDLWAYLASFSPAEGGDAEGVGSATVPAEGETASE